MSRKQRPNPWHIDPELATECADIDPANPRVKGLVWHGDHADGKLAIVLRIQGLKRVLYAVLDSDMVHTVSKFELAGSMTDAELKQRMPEITGYVLEQIEQQHILNTVALKNHLLETHGQRLQ